MWLLARPIESTCPLATQTGTSHQNGFSMSIQTPLLLAGLPGELQRRGILAGRAGDRQRAVEVEVQQRPALALVLAGQDVVEAVAVEPHERLLRRASPFAHRFRLFHQVMTGATCRSSARMSSSMSSTGRWTCRSPDHQPSAGRSTSRFSSTRELLRRRRLRA